MKKFVLFFGLVIFSICGYSQVKKVPTKVKPKPTIQTPKKPVKKSAILQTAIGDNSLLLEISGHGLTQPSYLFGTMHIVCEKDAILSEGLKKVIKESKQVYFEVDLDDLQEMMGLLQYVRMNDGRKISDLLTPVEYDRVKAYFEEHKGMMPFAMMNRFKPFFVSAMISENILSCDKKSSLEQEIMTEVKKYEKNILGLETLEFQASLFDSVPYETQAKDLLNYVDSIGTYRTLMEQTVDMYKRQDLKGLDSLTQLSDPGMAKYMDLMLYDRNKRWLAQISEQAFQMSTLFAVGAGHLGGEKGVINLLRKEGFTVRALKN
ncbi:MAG: TraB/GumN family protein [Flavitalea sp.]